MRLIVGHHSVHHSLDLLGGASEEDTASLRKIDCIAINLHCLHLGEPHRLRGARPGLLVR